MSSPNKVQPREYPVPKHFNIPQVSSTDNPTPLRTSAVASVPAQVNAGINSATMPRGAPGITRVMSPTQAGLDVHPSQAIVSYGASQPSMSQALSVLPNAQPHAAGIDLVPQQQIITHLGRGWAESVICPRCTVTVIDPYICSACGVYGHAGCLGIEVFEGLPFCGECFSDIVADFSSRRDAEMRESWRQSRAQQLLTIKSQTINLLGLSGW